LYSRYVISKAQLGRPPGRIGDFTATAQTDHDRNRENCAAVLRHCDEEDSVETEARRAPESEKAPTFQSKCRILDDLRDPRTRFNLLIQDLQILRSSDLDYGYSGEFQCGFRTNMTGSTK
jgi:hypothetical protein